MKLFKNHIGDKAFYKMVIALVIPLVVQQGITNFVSLLDNVMVGALSTEAMSGVAIVNQLVNVFNLALFGGMSGISIFGAQFFGVGDHEGVRHTFRTKMIFGVLVTAVAVVIFLIWGDPLVRLFLENEANAEIDITITLNQAKEYLAVMLVGLLPFMVVQAYAGTLREAGETVAPMKAALRQY